MQRLNGFDGLLYRDGSVIVQVLDLGQVISPPWDETTHGWNG